MDLQNRFVGSLSDFGRTDDEIRLRREDLLLRLLVCETVILKTARLLELRCLAEMLGAEGVLALINAGRLQLTCEAFATGFQLPPDATDENEFQFLCVWDGDRPKYLQDCLADVRKRGSSDVATLASEVPQYILEAPAQAESDRILAHLQGILLNGHPSLRPSIAAAFHRETGRSIDPAALSVEIRPRKTGGYRVSTNLFAVQGFSKLQIRTAVGRGVSSFAAAHARFEEMQRHHAIPGLPSETAATLAEHLEFLESQSSPDRQAARLRRIVEVADIPIAQGALTVDAQKLIDVTGSPECVQFRSWLRTTDSMTEGELRDQLSNLTSRLGLFVRSSTGKALRFLVNLGVGAHSPIGGLALSVVDTFVLESVLPVHGPIWFVDRVAKLVGTSEAGPT